MLFSELIKGEKLNEAALTKETSAPVTKRSGELERQRHKNTKTVSDKLYVKTRSVIDGVGVVLVISTVLLFVRFAYSFAG